MFPVVEAEKLVIRYTAKNKDKGHDEESDNAEDFKGCKPKFRLTIIPGKFMLALCFDSNASHRHSARVEHS